MAITTLNLVVLFTLVPSNYNISAKHVKLLISSSDFSLHSMNMLLPTTLKGKKIQIRKCENYTHAINSSHRKITATIKSVREIGGNIS